MLRTIGSMHYWHVCWLTFSNLMFFFSISLPFFYDSSSKFRYHFKVFLFRLLTVLFSVLLTPLIALSSRHFPSVGIWLISNTFCYITKLLNVKRQVIGLENLQVADSPAIISNYQNAFDILGLMEIWSHVRKCSVVTNHGTLFKFWLKWFSWCFYNDCAFFECHQDNWSDVTKNELNLKEKLWLFLKTEEIRNLDQHFYESSMKEKKTIILVVFSNYYFLDDNSKEFEAGESIIKVLPPIEASDQLFESAADLSESIEHKMQTAFKEVSDAVTPTPTDKLRKLYLTRSKIN